MLRSLIDTAQTHGLIYRGGFRVTQQDKVTHIAENNPAVAIVLFGNAGSSIWPHFSNSPEHSDGEADPLNRWSERVGTDLAKQVKGLALFPFGGPPYLPFLQWAKKAEALASSKIGMLIHPKYGLWHAYRFAIALPSTAIMGVANTTLLAQPYYTYPCHDCTSQACLNTCPVGAFTEGSYDVETCFHYLDKTPNAPCHEFGCQARAACPEGQSYLYEKAHAAFHMEQFTIALKARFKTD